MITGVEIKGELCDVDDEVLHKNILIDQKSNHYKRVMICLTYIKQ